MPYRVIMSAIVTCLATPSLFGQTSDSLRSRERLVWLAKGSNQDPFRLREFVPESGQVTLLRELPRTVVRLFHDQLLDQRGEMLQIGEKTDEQGRRTWQVITSPSDLPRLLSQAAPNQAITKGSFSPDGRSLVVSDWFHERVSICNGKTTHTVQLDRWMVSPFAFSWSPDSRRVAFYYAADSDDANVLQTGLVILDTEGQLRIVLKQEDATPTPRTWAKYAPPVWDPTGRYLYFIDGVPAAKDPPAAGRVINDDYSPSAVYRFDCETGTSEFITDGALAGLLAKENSLLLWPVPKQKEGGKWTLFAAKFSLADKKLTPLPDKIRHPRLSPSGRLVACISGGQVILCRTDDWSQIGKGIEFAWSPKWLTEVHWIAAEGTAAESSSAPSSTSAPAGT